MIFLLPKYRLTPPLLGLFLFILIFIIFSGINSAKSSHGQDSDATASKSAYEVQSDEQNDERT